MRPSQERGSWKYSDFRQPQVSIGDYLRGKMDEPGRDEPATFPRHDPAKTKDSPKPSGYILDTGRQDWS